MEERADRAYRWRRRAARHLDWSEQGVSDLDNVRQLSVMYERVLGEAMSADDLRRWVDADCLRRVWPRMWLPRRVRELWEGRFPELRGEG